MYNLYSFLLGIFFIMVVYPILTDIYSIIAQGVEYINTKIACKTAQLQLDLQKANEDADDEGQTFAMGFQYDGEEEYWDDDDEWEDN